MKELGLIAENVEAHEVVAPGYSEWEDMSPQEQAMSSRCMAAYAGMIEAMDQNIGRVMTYLKQTKQYDNTVILFMSDNGAEGAALEASRTHAVYEISHILQTDDILRFQPSWAPRSWMPFASITTIRSKTSVHGTRTLGSDLAGRRLQRRRLD